MQTTQPPTHVSDGRALRRIGTWCAVLSLCVLLLGCSRPTEPPVTANVRGATILILRIPNGNQPSTDILLRHDDATMSPWAVRTLVGDSDYNALIHLSESDWRTLDALYRSWCQHRPTFSAARPAYEVAIQCGIQHFELHIPPNELPEPLYRLNQVVPPVQRMIDGVTPTPR